MNQRQFSRLNMGRDVGGRAALGKCLAFRRRGASIAPPSQGDHCRQSELSWPSARNGRDRRHCRLSRARGPRRRGAGAARRRPAALHHRRPARQGGRRKPRAGAGGLGLDRPGAAAQANHRQPVAGRSAQGRLAFRFADRAWPAGSDRRHRCRKPVALCRGRRAWPRRADRRFAGRAAGGIARVGRGQGPGLPGGAGGGSGLGRRCRSAGGARFAGLTGAFEGHQPVADPAAGRGRAAARRSGLEAGQGPGNRQKGAGDRRRRRP